MPISKQIFYILLIIFFGLTQFQFSQKNSIDTLISIYKNDNKNPENIINIGELYASEKKWDLAIDFYEKLVALDPENADYLYRLGGTQAAYSEVVSKFKVLPLINNAKRNLIKSASLDNQHIFSRWALVQILTELPKLLGGNKDDALKYCEEILNISKIHGLISYYYFHSFLLDEKKIAEYEKRIIELIKSDPALFDFNYFNFIIGKILANQNDKIYNRLSPRYLQKYITDYSSADRFSLDEVYYLLAYSSFKLNDNKSKYFIKVSKEILSKSNSKNHQLVEKINELEKLIIK